jgi:hypothetical protein
VKASLSAADSPSDGTFVHASRSQPPVAGVTLIQPEEPTCMLDGSVEAGIGGWISPGKGRDLNSGSDGMYRAGVRVAVKKGDELPGLETRTWVPPLGASVNENSARYLGTIILCESNIFGMLVEDHSLPQFCRPLRTETSVETYIVVIRKCLLDTGLLNSPGMKIISSYGPRAQLAALENRTKMLLTNFRLCISNDLDSSHATGEGAVYAFI